MSKHKRSRCYYRLTEEQFRFFGIEVELWRIGDSHVAPNFNIISKPNDWTKATRKAGRPDPERTKRYRELWSRFIEAVNQDYPLLEFPNPSGLHWIRFFMHGTRFVLSYAPTTKMMSLYLLFREDAEEGWLQFLHKDRKSIHQEVGKQLEWTLNDDGTGYVTVKFDFDDMAPDGRERIFGIGSTVDKVRAALESRKMEFDAPKQSGG